MRTFGYVAGAIGAASVVWGHLHRSADFDLSWPSLAFVGGLILVALSIFLSFGPGLY